MQTGIKIDANLSKELIINLFEPNTPLHDGAIVIQGEKIKSAACNNRYFFGSAFLLSDSASDLHPLEQKQKR